jgi:hypothetical protein
MPDSYTVLQCFGERGTPVAGLGASPLVEGVDSWIKGIPIDVPVPAPIEMELDPQEPGAVLDLYQLDVLIMSKRLIDALGEAGVDNLEVFDLVLVDPATGARLKTHRLVNVVGAVACADMARSKTLATRGPAMIDVDFDSLAIDETRTEGFLFFRLAECLTAILVHDRVRRHLIDRGFTSLTFQPPAEFVG